MQCPSLVLRVAAALFIIVYSLCWLDIDYEQMRSGLFVTRATKAPTMDIFDHCFLEEVPTWTEELHKMLDPDSDPVKNCDHSFRPWSRLAPSGAVELTDAWDNSTACRARAVAHKSETKTTMGAWHAVSEQYVFENDIVEVECKEGKQIVYNFLHSQIWRPDKKNKKRGRAKRSPKKREKSEKNEPDRPPNIYIIVIDSVGASHGRRVFTQTYRYLKEQFGAVEMMHVNKVGENSRPNGTPFLYGKSIVAVPREVYGLPSLPADWSKKESCYSYLDDKGFILKLFEQKGYKTLMAEDWAQGVFNWPDCWGFRDKPTTHYMRPFAIRLNKDAPRQMGKDQGTGNCFEQHLFLNEYADQFVDAYPDSPQAVLTWASYLAHDYVNQPFHSDKQYREYFERHRAQFDDAFVFFMGDHGLRFGSYIKTPSGRNDMDNPMLVVSVPRRLRNTTDLLANLETNSKQLLTSFDIHASFVDIAESFPAAGTHANFSESLERTGLKGSSFLRPLPEGPRNCKTLPIPPQYCLCKTEKEAVNITSAHDSIGEAIAAVVNARLVKANVSDICAALELEEVASLFKVSGTKELYEATVSLSPGEGLFKTFVRGSNRTGYSLVVPDVTRINKYGHLGDCTPDNELRPICYCKSNLAETNSTSTPSLEES